MLIKKVLAFVLSLALSVSMTACGEKNGDSSSGDKGGKPYVAVVSKGFQHQFWQIVKKGASQAAADLGVTLTFEGPQTESDVNQQVEMLKSAMNKQPDAICLAALDTSSVVEQLNECRNKNIPVVGFDSGVPEAPEGSIYATASTDNYRAAAIAAEQLLKNEDFLDKLAAGNNVVVGVLSQDAISDSILRRTSGFIDTLVEGLEAMEGFAGAVEVVGHDTFRKNAGSAAKVTVRVNVPATTAAADMKTGAEALLSTQNLAAIYGSNENAAGGILAASNDGNDFNRERGKFKDVVAIGFDAGKTQRTAVENGWFYGSVTQDPYQIGYQAVALAVDAINGKPAESPVVDTGAKWYDADTLKDESISQLVYE